jgi:hypothetical protein
MDHATTARLNRLIAATDLIRTSADRLLTIALYLRDRACDIGPDDQAMLNRFAEQITDGQRDLDSAVRERE